MITSNYLVLVGPPLIGALIGYLTNKIAIRMLFRPLRAWHVFGLRVPMTPGVIPASRHKLAVNIGNMVGEQLLTSRDIGEALSRERFQDHLRSVVDGWVEVTLARELEPVIDLVPSGFKAYLTAGVAVFKHKVLEIVQQHIHGDAFATRLSTYLEESLDALVARQVDDLLAAGDRAALYQTIDRLFAGMMEREQTGQWLAGYLLHLLEEAENQGKVLGDFLPDPLRELIRTAIIQHVPALLQQLALLLREEPVRERIIAAVQEGVRRFLASLGPLGAMATGFFHMDVIAGKIRHYLDTEEEQIVAWLQHDEVKERFQEMLLKQAERLFALPVADLLRHADQKQRQAICRELSRQVLAGLQSEGVRTAFGELLRGNLEEWLGGGQRRLADLIKETVAADRQQAFRESMARKFVALLRAPRSARLFGSMIGTMIDSVLQRPLGRLDRILPRGVCSGLAGAIVTGTNRMLLKEVPDLVDSLDIRRIVTDKVNSLDLLQVEGLLLSIMKEHFTYINIFGALLGFLIGLGNLLLPLIAR